MQKNYYLVLGLTSDASTNEIKEAYRRLAKKFHPDRSGKEASPFLDIQEAYSILSDPVKRSRHDRSITMKPPRGGPASGEAAFASRPVEPLVPGSGARGETGPDRFGEFRPPGAESLRWRGFKRRRPEPLTPQSSGLRPEGAEVRLTPDQARQGGEVRLGLSGHGTFVITYPPGVTDGQSLKIPLDRMGFPGRGVFVTFRVLSTG